MTAKISFPSNAWRHVIRILLTLVVALTAVLGLALDVSADPDPTWRGEYYNNTNLEGYPGVVRDDASINFDWGNGSPASGINADNFSVNWTTFTQFNAGTYTFHVTSDDGVRLWVDDQLIIDQWNDHPVTTYSATKYLGSGYHSIRLTYYEHGGQAVCKLWWGTGTTPAGEWRAEYYNNTWLGGTPVVRNESSVYHDWGYGSPVGGINADYFSARWTRNVHFSSDATYTFSATVDDGVRVWVDGAVVIDKWYPQSRTTHTGSIYLGAGTHQVKVEYFERTGVALCLVSWTGGGGWVPGGEEIIVDNQDSNFIWGGPASSWYGRYTGYRGHLNWTWNSRTQTYNWAKWFPYVSVPGNYDVYVYIPSRYHGSKSARYVVSLNGAQHARVVNQNNYYNQWVSLGTYYLSGGSGEYVYLSDATGETYGTRFVGFDAVKFVRSGGTPSPPSPPPSGCAITPLLGFGRIWNGYSTVRAKLGCPADTEKSVWAAEQSFSGGYMFWRQDQQYLYVLYNNGTWQGFGDTWTSGEPEWDPGIVPPPGYYQPKRGFGKVWRDQAGVRNALGWATMEEHGFQGSVQPFDGGIMLWSPARGIYVLYNDGTWAHYN